MVTLLWLLKSTMIQDRVSRHMNLQKCNSHDIAHTLEHLCFMGSRKYPYKGVLDKIATRSYSDTNAWTDNSETVYTLSSAGWAGFAQILPIYLDHLIVPTLTDAGCYTEVHHVDGKGEDAGSVTSPRNHSNLLTITELSTRRCKHVKIFRVT
jgi:hypothetical protein